MSMSENKFWEGQRKKELHCVGVVVKECIHKEKKSHSK